MSVVGVDVGGTSVKGGRTDGRTASRPTAGDALAALREVLAELVDDGVTALGVGVPGVLDGGTVRFAANLGWRDLPLARLLEEEFGRPVTLAADVAAAAVAESDGRDLLFVAIGTGLAAASVRDGRAATAELGHVVLDPNGPPCACGRRGCVETFVSGPAIARRHGTLDAAGVAVATDPHSRDVWAAAMRDLGRALATAVLVLDPPEIVLGGGVAAAGDALLGPVRDALATELPWRPVPPVRLARLGTDAGWRGALLLASGAVSPGPAASSAAHRSDVTTGPGAQATSGSDPLDPAIVSPRAHTRDRGAGPGAARVLTGARVVTLDGVRDWVEIAGGRIVGVGDGPRNGEDLGGGWLVPGFVDLHVHGGGGHDMSAGPEAMRGAVDFHRAHGTTDTLVSLMAAPIDALCAQLDWVRVLHADGVVAGAHLEGPFLSTARCGAQAHEHLLDPDLLVLTKLLDAAQGCLRSMTVAPELPGAVALVEELVAAGVVAAIGHTDASYAEAAAAIEAGATLATHAFNAMSPITSRGPGPAVAAVDAGIAVELIADGTHVHDALGRLLVRAARHQLVLVTDATSATGLGDGTYALGGRPVEVQDGTVRLPGSHRLAGSTLTMDRAFRHAVRELGLTVPQAVHAAATLPARVIGADAGVIAPGARADLVHLDDDLHLVAVL